MRFGASFFRREHDSRWCVGEKRPVRRIAGEVTLQERDRPAQHDRGAIGIATLMRRSSGVVRYVVHPPKDSTWRDVSRR